MDGKKLKQILQNSLVGSREAIIIFKENVENISFITPLWMMNHLGKISLEYPDVIATITSRPWAKEENRAFKIILPKKFDKNLDSFVEQMHLGIEKIITTAVEQGNT